MIRLCFNFSQLHYFCIMQNIPFYQEAFTSYLNAFITDKKPENLYNPIHYILKLGGKRLRPVLTLMTTEIFNSDYKKALDAALSIEVFHNFSLVHDDIMDDAPLRRGQKTVHEKWDINTGILSGDAMLIQAYQLFENYESKTFQSLAKLFSKTALEVCEGQQYDIDFETRDDVTVPEYLKMIEFKTAVLVGAAMKMGAIIARASKDDQNKIYDFGKYLGIAFQLQDDYLDAFGDEDIFGKKKGGDIRTNKKTFLYLKALELGSEEQRKELKSLFSTLDEDNDEKVEKVLSIFKELNIEVQTKQLMDQYYDQAMTILEKIDLNINKKVILTNLADKLMKRAN